MNRATQPTQAVTEMAGTGNVRYVNAGARLDAFDREGCAHGQVTRERVDQLADKLDGIESKIGMLTAGVFLQLLGFLLGVVLFALNHVHVV